MLWKYLAFALIGSAAAQVPEFGNCPNVAVKPDFDITKFIGKWYEAQRYFNVFEVSGKCVTVTYSANPNGTINVVYNLISSVSDQHLSFEGIASQNKNETAKLTVVFPSLPYQVKTPYWVVDTDYESFAVIWSCQNIGIFSVQFAWVLTREQLPTKSSLEKAHAVFDKNEIDRSILEVTDQENCTYD